jgi:Zn-dependent protease
MPFPPHCTIRQWNHPLRTRRTHSLNQLSPDDFFDVLAAVKAEFEVTDAYLMHNVPTFAIAPTYPLEPKLHRLRQTLQAMRLQVVLRREKDGLLLQAVPVETAAPQPPTFLAQHYPLLLFALTILTVTITGYFNATTHMEILQVLGRSPDVPEGLYVAGMTAAYTISLLAVLGLHELGHTLACRRHHIEASLPIFIPGIPLLTPGTFGALIRQKDPALDRNQLFDIGLSGPFVSFVTALAISALGYSLSLPISEEEYFLLTSLGGEGQFLFLPLLFQWLSPYLFPSPTSFTHILHPLALSGWMATLLTFLNIFPIGQLDGGHVARAVLGATWHRRVSYAMVLVMLLTGWWSMALLVLLFVRNRHPGVLDEATPLSPSRKALSILVVVIFLTCFTPSAGSPLIPLLYGFPG